MYKQVQTFNTQTKEWSVTDFETKEDFKKFVWSKFIPPGELKLKNSWAFRQEAIAFEKNGFYNKSAFKSIDYRRYWDTEKDKCLNGIIVDDFYITQYYYFWLNFLPINDKKINKLKFPAVYDSQYYFFIYLELCHLEFKYSVVVKKRQWGSTFQHLAVLINDTWFQQAYINKVAAADDEFLKADWAILEEYRNFLNTHTGWYRQFSPDKSLNWHQRVEIKESNRKSFRGNMSILKGLNLKLSASKGVGGKNNKFYYEETGMSKTVITTYNYIDPALRLGALTTGMFMAGGSVGELDQCEGLKSMALNPHGFNILSVKNVFDPGSEYQDICFFVPEYWSMDPFFDEDGNSDIEKSIAWCLEERARRKASSTPEDYRMYVSQHPFSLGEAFAWRKESIFPQALIIGQQERLTVSNKQPQLITLERDAVGKITHKLCDDCQAISHFPLEEKDNKQGAIQMYEPPIADPPMFTYFAGIDPVAIGKTTSSPSLFSIYIMKNLVETTEIDEEGNKSIKVDGYKIVASYTGRYDDVTKTNEIAEMMLMYYNALAAVENNVMSFINHMQSKGLQRYLATRDQLSFVSELKTNANVYCPYGFKNNPTIWNYFVDVINEYVTVEMDVLRTVKGDKLKTIHGIERIDDYLLLEEMKNYHEKLNVDRLVAFGAALAIMKSHSKYNIGVVRVAEEKAVMGKIAPPERSFFKHIANRLPAMQKQRSFFKTRH